MIAIHFIVNPIAGSGNHHFSENFFLDYFEDDNYRIIIKTSEYKGHAICLTKESIHQNADVIVACGGDGTINEVASTLVGTSIALGILPMGSGNGLSSNLNIPKSIEKALAVIKRNQVSKIDVGYVNERAFFSNTGFGFTASVIKNYEASQKRTLVFYVKAVFSSYLQFSKPKENIIVFDGKLQLDDPFLIFVSNSNVMGYNMSLTPKASLKDGLLDIVIIPKIGKVKMLFFGFCMLIKRPQLLKEVRYYQADKLTLLRNQGSEFYAQIDGELVKITDTMLTISLKKDSLNVLVSLS